MTITVTRSHHLVDAAEHVRVLVAVALALFVVVVLVTAAGWSGVDRGPAPVDPGVTARPTPTAIPFGQA